MKVGGSLSPQINWKVKLDVVWQSRSTAPAETERQRWDFSSKDRFVNILNIGTYFSTFFFFNKYPNAPPTGYFLNSILCGCLVPYFLYCYGRNTSTHCFIPDSRRATMKNKNALACLAYCLQQATKNNKKQLHLTAKNIPLCWTNHMLTTIIINIIIISYYLHISIYACSVYIDICLSLSLSHFLYIYICICYAEVNVSMCNV